VDGERTLTFGIAGQPRAGTETEINEKRVILAPSSPWYPRLASTWGTSAVTIRVPPGWGAAATGTPSARMAAGVFRFTNDKPVRTIAIAAAPALKSADGMLMAVPFRMAATSSTVPLKTVTPHLAPAMAWLSGALAPYPFESFQLVTLPGYAGRVTGSGIAIVGAPLTLTTDADGADLLAGQWFGEAVGGDGAWIESFAAWEACVFARDRALPIPSAIAKLRAAYFQLMSGDVPLSKAPATAPEEVLRGKGSAAPDMVRLIAGDRAMFDALREVFAAPPGPPLTLAALRAVIERHAQRPLERVFTEWFDRPGAPELSAELRKFPAASGGFRADIRLIQKRGIYALPVEVVIHGAGDSHRETVELDGETTSVFYIVPFEPTRIEIDPLERLFRWK